MHRWMTFFVVALSVLTLSSATRAAGGFQGGSVRFASARSGINSALYSSYSVGTRRPDLTSRPPEDLITVVPSRGELVTRLPQGARKTIVNGGVYFVSNGVYYAATERGGRTVYIVTRP